MSGLQPACPASAPYFLLRGAPVEPPVSLPVSRHPVYAATHLLSQGRLTIASRRREVGGQSRRPRRNGGDPREDPHGCPRGRLISSLSSSTAPSSLLLSSFSQRWCDVRRRCRRQGIERAQCLNSTAANNLFYATGIRLGESRSRARSSDPSSSR